VSRLSSPERVTQLGDRLAELLPGAVGAPGAVERLVSAGVSLSLLGGVLALVPVSFYGEGLRRALLRFSSRKEGLTGWKGWLASLPVVLLTPLLPYPLLLTGR
jgi:membrane protein